MTLKFTFYIFLVIILFNTTVHSETILLRNGQIVQGKVLGHDSESVTINTDGVTKVIPKSTVHKVIFSSNSPEIQKFLQEKKKLSKMQKKPDSGKLDDDDEISNIDEMVEEKQDINKKVSMLEQKIDKYEKKISHLRSKINKLKQKIKSKSSN